MARNIGADGRDVFRAIITSTPPGKPRATWHEGPYTTHGAARARVTFWTNHLRDADTGAPYASGYVERAVTRWEPVNDNATKAAADRTVLCAHGYGLLRDSCPGCDAAEERPHTADPVTVRPSWAKRAMRRCRRCAQVPSARIHKQATG
ncbi:hypothetical protein ACWGJ2_04350 [Streptomyces sp. NPDC054796]